MQNPIDFRNPAMMTTAAIDFRLEELDPREYILTPEQSSEWAALWDERRKRSVAEAAEAFSRFLRGC